MSHEPDVTFYKALGDVACDVEPDYSHIMYYSDRWKKSPCPALKAGEAFHQVHLYPLQSEVLIIFSDKTSQRFRLKMDLIPWTDQDAEEKDEEEALFLQSLQELKSKMQKEYPDKTEVQIDRCARLRLFSGQLDRWFD